MALGLFIVEMVFVFGVIVIMLEGKVKKASCSVRTDIGNYAETLRRSLNYSERPEVNARIEKRMLMQNPFYLTLLAQLLPFGGCVLFWVPV